VNAASEDWQTWLETTGMEGVDPSDGLHVDTIQLAFEAASMGLGVALGRRPLVDRDLVSGALVEAASSTIASSTAYWLVSAEDAQRRPELLDFRQWMLSEAGQSFVRLKR